jgi:hypothetical protein
MTFIDLAKEGSPLQILTAIGFICAGLVASHLKNFNLYLQTLIAGGCLWLALDELVMVHECGKIFLHNQFQLQGVATESVLLVYMALAILLFIRLAKHFVWNRQSKIAFVSAVFFAGFAMTRDVFDSSHQEVLVLMEEFFELFFAICILVFFLAQPRTRFCRDFTLALCVSLPIAIFAIDLFKHAYCEQIFRIITIKYWGPFPYQ